MYSGKQNLLIFILGIFLISFVWVKKRQTVCGYIKDDFTQRDSLKADSLQDYINQYCSLNKSLDSLAKIIGFKRSADTSILIRIEKLNADIKKDSSSKWIITNTFWNDSARKQELAHYDSLIKFSVRKISILRKLLSGKEIDKLEREWGLKYSALMPVINNLRICSGLIVGSRAIVFNGVRYHLFVSDLDSNVLRMHLIRPKSKSSLGNVKELLESQKIYPLMITNAGMFTATYEPEGLYIEENPLKKYPLDIADQKSNLNFYLKPNGVFYLDNKNVPHIDTTQEFARLQKSGKLKVKLATQSGPMLVINGRIHPAFVKGSSNRKIRSGVGIINNKRIVFAVTLEGSNFYDFAVFLRDIFYCDNALFLDGAISRMYLHDIDSTETGGEFGPIISVSKKGKK